MVLHGRIQNGVVVFDGNPALSEGTPVVVSLAASGAIRYVEKQRIELPLVLSDRLGSLQLSGEQIAEILDGEME